MKSVTPKNSFAANNVIGYGNPSSPYSLHSQDTTDADIVLRTQEREISIIDMYDRLEHAEQMIEAYEALIREHLGLNEELNEWMDMVEVVKVLQK
jgi:hypothetical protein